jgi:hypothetical protein
MKRVNFERKDCLSNNTFRFIFVGFRPTTVVLEEDVKSAEKKKRKFPQNYLQIQIRYLAFLKWNEGDLIPKHLISGERS